MPHPPQTRSVNPLVGGGEKLLRPIVSVFNFLTEDIPAAADIKERVSGGIESLLGAQVEREAELRKQLPPSQRFLATGASTLSAELHALTAIAPGAPIDVLDVLSAGAALPFTKFLKGTRLAGKMTELAKFDDAEDVITLVRKARPEANDPDIITAMTNSLMDADGNATGVSNQQMLTDIDKALFGGKGKIEEASFDTGKREVFESLQTEGGAIRREVEDQAQAQSIESILEESELQIVTIRDKGQLRDVTANRNAARERVTKLEARDIRSNVQERTLRQAKFDVSKDDKLIRDFVSDQTGSPKTNPPIVDRDLGGPQTPSPTTTEIERRIKQEAVADINASAAQAQIEEWKNLRPRVRSPQQEAMQ